MRKVTEITTDYYEYVEYGLMSLASFCYVYSIAQISSAGIV